MLAFVDAAVLQLDVERLCRCAAAVLVEGMSLSLLLPGIPLPAPQLGEPELPAGYWQACCRALAGTFLASPAQHLQLQPARACTVPHLRVPDDGALRARAAHAFSLEAILHAAEVAAAPGGAAALRYSAPPPPAEVAAARRDAASSGVLVPARRNNLLEHMPGVLSCSPPPGGQLELLQVRPPNFLGEALFTRLTNAARLSALPQAPHLWGPAVYAASVHLAKRGPPVAAGVPEE